MLSSVLLLEVEGLLVIVRDGRLVEMLVQVYLGIADLRERARAVFAIRHTREEVLLLLTVIEGYSG